MTLSARRVRFDALDAVADPQFGTFTWTQALAAGYPSSTVSSWVADRHFRRIHPTVYTRQMGALGLDTLRAAALLATGPESALIKRAALALFDCSRFGSKRMQIGVRRRNEKHLADVDVEQSRAHAPGHVVVHAGHRVTSMAWTITDLGCDLAPEQIANVIQQARLRGRLQLEEVDNVLALRGRFRGSVNVRKALAMYRAGSAGTRSVFEDMVYGWVKEIVQRAPYPNQHVRAGDQEFEVDIPFALRMLCIEVDGPLHDDPEQKRKDQVRDAALRAAGYRVVRIHWRDIKFRPAMVRRQLRELLG